MSLEARAKEAFLGVLGAADRAAALDLLCAGDGALRERVALLLSAHDSQDALDEDPAPVGEPTHIAGYTVVRRLGAGGMGIVYECEQQHPRRRVAVKVLHPWLATAEGRRRVEREAQMLTLLRHPGIAQVYAAGELPGGVPYLVMELVPGAAPLTQHAQERRLPRETRLVLLADACDAVHAAHLQGVIHRDLKPANLLVDEGGQVRVIDFGVGRAAGADTVLTQAGQVVGTLRYMSPEQADGSPPDVRGDVYALGVVLHELLLGTVPLDLEGLTFTAALARVRKASGVDAAALNGLPRDLRAVVLRALAPRPADRYQSAALLAEDLRRFLAGRDVQARPPGRLKRVLLAAARHPVLTPLAALATTGACIVAGTWVAVFIIALRPETVVIPSDRRSAEMYSRGNQRVASWEAGPRGQVLFARMVSRPAGLGGRLVLVGMDQNSTGPAPAGEVTAYLPGEPAVPAWSTARYPLKPPALDHHPAQFTTALDLAMVQDVLPEAPGDELVCVQSLYPNSATAIRVFDLSGTLRYAVWHDGAIRSVEWLPGPGLLVLTGVNSETSWDGRGRTSPSGNRYPIVVFALAPRDGVVSDARWIVDEPADPTLRWYRWLGPADLVTALDNAYATLEPAARLADRADHVLFNFILAPRSGDTGGVVFYLDSKGRVLTRWSDDGYKTQLGAGRAPPMEDFVLRDYDALPATSGRER